MVGVWCVRACRPLSACIRRSSTAWADAGIGRSFGRAARWADGVFRFGGLEGGTRRFCRGRAGRQAGAIVDVLSCHSD